jgi:uncharacterized protein YukE
MIRRGRRFRDLVERQLDLFAGENADLLEELRGARKRWAAAGVDEAEEAFGDEQDRVDWAAEALADIRDSYALTLDEDTADEYREAFARAARRRFGGLADAMGP